MTEGDKVERRNAPSVSRPTARASAISSPRSTRSATPRRPISPPNTRRATRSLRNCARAASATKSLLYAAKQELGLRAFLEAGGFKGFTDTFEDLHGLKQLPGLAPQRLMADGYGFAGEGDWKTVALVRAMKVMAEGLPGGTSSRSAPGATPTRSAPQPS